MTALRKGDWIQTYTGRQFWPLDPHPEEVDIIDIAHALSLLCRFGGHCKEFYSVAEHSVLVSRAVPAEAALWGLMHDASEAYLCDLPRPIKRELPDYQQAETRILMAVAVRCGLPWPKPLCVNEVDHCLLEDERQHLMNPCKIAWGSPLSGLGIKPECWTPDRAKWEFLARFQQLRDAQGCR